MPKPYTDAEIPLAMALAMGGLSEANFADAIAEHRDQVLTEAAAMLRNATVRAHETDGVDAAADLLLAARSTTAQES